MLFILNLCLVLNLVETSFWILMQICVLLNFGSLGKDIFLKAEHSIGLDLLLNKPTLPTIYLLLIYVTLINHH